MSEIDAIEISRRQANLRYLLNRWDPLGVADLVDDEYDCLLVPLWNRIVNAACPAAVSEFLWCEIEDHFGLDPSKYRIDEVAHEIVALAASWSANG